ncbi:site-specific integrase [Kribbella sp. NPDC023972]|uniref:tyrosine-type recombinase/integrase n=1 Tax=Kribbella sp. NPDC023972 TaxID=3154795 RepID=UPI0033EBA2CB
MWRQAPACIAASAATSMTTVGATLVMGVLGLLRRPVEMLSGLGSVVLSGRRSRARGRGTDRPRPLRGVGCFELAVADEILKRNPAKSKIVKRPVIGDSDIVVWSDETVDAIVEAHPERFQLIPIIGAGAGLRQGEIFALAPEDFDFDEKLIRVRRQVKKLGRHFVFALPKNDRERVVPMSEHVAELVQDHIERFGTTEVSLPWERLDGAPRTVRLLFIWSDGKQIRARNYEETIWKPALAGAGVISPPTRDNRGRRHYTTDRKTGMHALRHHYASVTLHDGVNIKELAEYLGHHDPGFTLRLYTHLLPSSHDKARQAVDRRMARLRLRLTEQRRSRDDSAAA